MALWYVINDMQVGVQKRYAGELINDAVISTATLTAAGVILWPSADPIVAAAAANAQALKKRGQSFPNQQATSMMVAAVLASVAGGAALSAGTPGSGQPVGAIQKSTVTVGATQMTASGTVAFNVGVPLPNNARVLAHEIRVLQPFVGSSVTSVAVALGTKGIQGGSGPGSTGTNIMFLNSNEIVTVQSLGATGSFIGTAGVDPNALYSPSGAQLLATISSSGEISGMTGGLMTVDILWTALP
jgi:hypothetical protein